MVLELVQLQMARSPAPSDEHAASAAVDLMRFSLVQRTQHTHHCQLRAVTWRLQHERTAVARLERSLDNAADAIIDLEDEREELLDENHRLRRDLHNIRLAGGGPGIATRVRASVLEAN